MKSLIIILTFILISGCSSVTMRTDDHNKNYQPATYQKKVIYWWWGLSGVHDINVREACKGRPVEQMQSTSTFTDALSFIFTLGIYMPRTAKIWCQSDSHPIHLHPVRSLKEDTL